MTTPLLSISGLEKSYAVPVLKGIDLQISKGEVHALVGANGAGKTTLCNIITGLVTAENGQMFLNGEPHSPASIRSAEAAGIQFVMQELNLVDDLSVAENLYLGNLPTRGAWIDFKQLYAQATNLLEEFGLEDIDSRQPVASLGIGQRQLVIIARALTKPCRLLILDEPTAALTDPQINRLFEEIRKLQARGTAVIYISHRMDEIGQIADRVSVLRDGDIIATRTRGDIEADQVVSLMAGEISPPTHKKIQESRNTRALTIRGLSTEDKLRNVDLDIHFGEVLGIAGLVGSGRTELLRAIFAADQKTGGRIVSGSADTQLELNSPVDAVAHGIALIPEDRKDQGLFIHQSITTNMTLASLGNYSHATGWIDSASEQKAISEMLKLLAIKCNHSHQLVRELSGGNQQKVSIARNLLLGCNILLFDEPTRGVDIHAKRVIYQLLDRLAAEGKAVVIVSSETRELTQVCDHIAVMSDGFLTEVFSRKQWTPEKIMEASFRAYTKQDTS